MNTEFEKKKLYHRLGTGLVNALKSHNAIVAGGTIASLFNGLPINDIDVYFRSEDDLMHLIEDVYEDNNDWVNALTDKALLVRISDSDVQMIYFKFFEDAKEIFSTFDFTVCMGAFDFKDEQFYFHDDFMKHNSQRILRFNKGTAFPLVSLLRVQKYKEKGFSISKPEFVRIALRCMDLKIETAEDLKTHLSGMYGESVGKIVEFKEDEEFSLDAVIDRIADLAVSDSYFKEPEKIKFNSQEELMDAISKEPIKVIELNGSLYKVRENGSLSEQLIFDPIRQEEVDAEEYFKDKRFYKFVGKDYHGYYSHYKNQFRYKLGETVVDEKNGGMYFNDKTEIRNSTYFDQGVLIEVETTTNGFKDRSGKHILLKSCVPVREIPKEEWKQWIEN